MVSLSAYQTLFLAFTVSVNFCVTLTTLLWWSGLPGAGVIMRFLLSKSHMTHLIPVLGEVILQNQRAMSNQAMDRIGSRPLGSSQDGASHSTTTGLDYIRNPRLFKGMGFTLDERQALGIHGLLPPRVKSQAEQTDNCLRNCKL